MNELVVDLKEMHNRIIGDDDVTVEIPLKDLIWTIIMYSQQMSNIEKEAFQDYPYIKIGRQKRFDDLIKDREYKACRRDELARLISTYSDFDTKRLWVEVDTLFKDFRNEYEESED